MTDPTTILAECLWEDSNRDGTAPVTIHDHGHARDWGARLAAALVAGGWTPVKVADSWAGDNGGHCILADEVWRP